MKKFVIIMIFFLVIDIIAASVIIVDNITDSPLGPLIIIIIVSILMIQLTKSK